MHCGRWMSHIPSFGRQQYIRVCVDTYSGFVMATPQTGEAVKHVRSHLLSCFAQHGVPQSIKTDNGPAYTSSAFRNFCTEFAIHHTTGIPYNSQGQAIVEHTNRTIKMFLQK